MNPDDNVIGNTWRSKPKPPESTDDVIQISWRVEAAHISLSTPESNELDAMVNAFNTTHAWPEENQQFVLASGRRVWAVGPPSLDNGTETE